MSLLLRGGRVIDPANNLDAVQDVLLAHGKIERLGRSLEAPEGTRSWTASGKIVCPVIDMHVHLRERATSTRRRWRRERGPPPRAGSPPCAAWRTRIPSNDNGAVTDYILAKGEGRGRGARLSDGAVTRACARGAGRAGRGSPSRVAVPSPTTARCVMTRACTGALMEYTLPFGAPLISHAEDASLSRGASMNEGVVSTETGLPGQRPRRRDVMVAATSFSRS